MIVPASPSLVEPMALAALSRRYGAGAPAVVELIRRTGGCTSPIRLEGESVAVSAGTGAALARRSTRAQAPGFVLVACGNRRESRCPPCSERYRRDAYFLVAAGLSGSEEKGVSTTNCLEPAPSLRCSPRHRSGRCIAGLSMPVAVLAAAGSVARRRHAGTDCPSAAWSAMPRAIPGLAGRSPDCYDYDAAALWNANLGALWRRTITYLPRELAALGGLSVAALRGQVRVAYAKVAEFQARGAVHVHAVIRLDGPDGPETAPTAWATAQRLAEAVGRAAARVSVTVEGSSGRELIVRWGEQIDVRPITPDLADGSVSQTAVAGYIAKYATKDAQVAGGLDRRIRYARQIDLAEVTEHARRLMSSALILSPRWAHSFGFRGHFLTKGRRYSLTFRALRGARAAFREQADPWLAEVRARARGTEVIVLRSLRYAGSGLSPAERAIAAGIRASEVITSDGGEKAPWRPSPSP